MGFSEGTYHEHRFGPSQSAISRTALEPFLLRPVAPGGGRDMRGSPRSLWLSMANRAAGWWTSAAVAAVQRQQRAMLGGIP